MTLSLPPSFLPSQKALRRWRVALLLMLALVAAPGAMSGCGYNPFEKQPTVADAPEQAFKDGEAKEEAAKKAEADGRKEEALTLWNEAANYYGAVSRKFAGSDNGLRALIEQAEVTENGTKNNYGAQTILKSARKQYTNETPLRDELEKSYNALEQKMDAENAKTPWYKVMDSIVRLFGNDPKVSPVLAIIAIAVLVTLVVWPLRARQYRSAKEMQRYQPELKKIQQKYKDDPQLAMAKQQAFYKEHNINQFAGCLPVLLQAPVTLAMYQVILHYQFHFSQTTFLWMNPEAARASAQFPMPFTHAIAHNLGEHDLLLLVIYAISMYLQTKLMPTTPTMDPQQLEQQKIMSIMMPMTFFIMMLQWQPASAFVLYWFISNVLGLIQQAIIYKTLPPVEPFVPKTSIDDAVTVSGEGDAPKPMVANPKLVSPKNKRKK